MGRCNTLAAKRLVGKGPEHSTGQHITNLTTSLTSPPEDPLVSQDLAKHRLPFRICKSMQPNHTVERHQQTCSALVGWVSGGSQCGCSGVPACKTFGNSHRNLRRRCASAGRSDEKRVAFHVSSGVGFQTSMFSYIRCIAVLSFSLRVAEDNILSPGWILEAMVGGFDKLFVVRHNLFGIRVKPRRWGLCIFLHVTNIVICFVITYPCQVKRGAFALD